MKENTEIKKSGRSKYSKKEWLYGEKEEIEDVLRYHE